MDEVEIDPKPPKLNHLTLLQSPNNSGDLDFCSDHAAFPHKNPETLMDSGMEAGAGIEPANRGFADLGLTTWLPRLGFEDAQAAEVRKKMQRISSWFLSEKRLLPLKGGA